MKRFTRSVSLLSGHRAGPAPVCAWVAVIGRLDWPPVAMFVIVAAWTAGFDIIYACQDFASDVPIGVFSVPAKIGIVSRALWVSRLDSSAGSRDADRARPYRSAIWAFFSYGARLGDPLLIVEQILVKSDDLSKVNLSFFTINGVISVLLATLGILDLIRDRTFNSNLCPAKQCRAAATVIE